MRQNLITNPSFETKTEPWQAQGSTAERTTATSRFGDTSIKLTANGTGRILFGLPYLIDVTPEATYTISAYFKTPLALANETRLYVEYYDNGTNWTYLGEAQSEALGGASDWTRRSITFTIPVGAHALSVYVPITMGGATAPAGEVVYIDGIMLEKSDTLGDYFDGDTPGFYWDGEPNNSTSSQYVPFPTVQPGPENLRLEIEAPPEGLQNLIQNPSGDKGAWGWATPVANTTLTKNTTGDDTSLQFTTTTSQAAYFTSEYLPAIGGKYYKARWDLEYLSKSTLKVKTRFDFYDSTRTFISSSLQTPATTTAKTYYTAAVQAPSTATWVKIRFDLYDGTANPPANAAFRFRRAMVTYTDEVSSLLTKYTNLIRNPSCETYVLEAGKGGWWAERNNGADCDLVRTAATGAEGSYAMKVTGRNSKNTNGNLHLYALPITWTTNNDYKATVSQWPKVTPGEDYTLSVRVKAGSVGRDVFLRLWWVKNAGSRNTADTFSYNQRVAGADKPGEWTTLTFTATAPSDAERVMPFFAFRDTPDGEVHYLDAVMLTKTGEDEEVPYFDGSTPDTDEYAYAWTGTPNDSTSTRTNKGEVFDYTDPSDWRDILGPTHEITVNREELNVGTLNATVLDAQLDPAVSDWITPGKQVRLRSLVEDRWESIYEGKITNADVNYTKPKTPIIGERLLATNLVPNPSFKDTTGNGNPDLWPYSGANFSGSIDGQTLTLTFNTTGGVGGGPEIQTTLDYVPVAGDTVSVAVTLGGTTQSTWTLRTLCYGNGAYLGVGGQTTSIVPDGSEVIATGGLQEGTTEVRLALYQMSDGVAGDTLTLSGARAVVGTFQYDYFDGDYDDAYYAYHWKGTPYASASTMSRAAIVPKVETRIAITASDNVSHLANQSESRGVEKIAELPLILEDKGAPWNVNGSGGQIATAPVVSWNENASVLDQVSITRDTALGYAWVDRQGILNAWDADKMASAAVVTFSDEVSADPTWLSYSDIAVNFNTDVCINDVTVTFLRYDVESSQTEEVVYGPYRDEDSIKRWGARSANFTIQGTEVPANIEAYAQSILATNGEPQVRSNSLQMPVRSENELKYATTLDLYTPVAVKYAGKVDSTYRITSISHSITPEKWTVDYAFDVQDSVAAPQVTPSPIKSGVADITPFNAINVKSTRDANTESGNTPALMVGPRSGSHLRIDGNEILSMKDDSTQGGLNLNLGGATNISNANITNLSLPTETSNGFDNASGWKINNQYVQKFGPFVIIYLIVERTGAGISVPASGNIPNEVVASAKVGYRCAITQMPLSSGGTGPMAAYYIGSGGDLTMTALPPGSGNIAKGDTFSVGGFYLAG